MSNITITLEVKREKQRLAQARYRKRNPEKIKAYSEKVRLETPEKAREVQARYRKKNSEKIKDYVARAYSKNKDREKERAAKWRKDNTDKVSLASKKYSIEHPEVRRIHAQNRRARKRAVGGRLSPKLADKLFKLQRGKCACCKQPLGDDYHLDHIMPISLGGFNTDDNIQLLRAACNQQKHAKHPIDFMQSRGFLL